MTTHSMNSVIIGTFRPRHEDSYFDLSQNEQEEEIREQLVSYLDDHPLYANVDYLLLNSGYTHRVIGNKEKRSLVPSNVLAIYHYESWDESFDEWPVWKSSRDECCQTAVRVTSKLYKDVRAGCFVYGNMDVRMTLDCIKDLQRMAFCGACKPNNLFKMCWYDVGGKTVCVSFIDTESG